MNTKDFFDVISLSDSSCFRIDSFSVLIPVPLFSRLPVHLFESVYTVSSTGEILDKKNRSFVYEFQGIKLRSSWKSLPNGERCVSMVITSKMLMSGYASGLNYSNLNDLGVFLASLGFEFYDSFGVVVCSSHIYDIDICYNFFMTNLPYDGFMSSFENNRTGGVVRYFYDRVALVAGDKFQKRRIGVQMSSRENNTKTNPFVKVYSKFYLKTDLSFFDYWGVHASDFYRDNLIRGSVPSFETLRRAEVNIKNKDHFISIAPGKVPSDLFYHSELRKEFFVSLFGRYVVDKEAKRGAERLRLSDMLLRHFIRECGIVNENAVHGLDLLCRTIPEFEDLSASEKTRMKNKLRKILHSL